MYVTNMHDAIWKTKRRNKNRLTRVPIHWDDPKKRRREKLRSQSKSYGTAISYYSYTSESIRHIHWLQTLDLYFVIYLRCLFCRRCRRFFLRSLLSLFLAPTIFILFRVCGCTLCICWPMRQTNRGKVQNERRK